MKSKLSCHLMLPVPKSQPQKFLGKTFVIYIKSEFIGTTYKEKDIVLLGSML